MREIVLLESNKCKIIDVSTDKEKCHKVEFEIHGKRHKFAKATCYVDQVIKIITDYKFINKSGYLLFPQLNGLTGKELLKEAAKIGKKYGDGIEYHTRKFWGIPNIGPHAFRRTFAATAFENGMQLATISKMLRHQSIKDSVKYVGDLTMQKEVDDCLRDFAKPQNNLSKEAKKKLFDKFNENYNEDDDDSDDSKNKSKQKKVKIQEERKSEQSESEFEMKAEDLFNVDFAVKNKQVKQKATKAKKSRSRSRQNKKSIKFDESDMEVD